MAKTKITQPELYRVCDANLNRLREGIRVIEDLARYYYNNKELALTLKKLRHKTQIVDNYLEMLKTRNSIDDVLKTSTKSEQQRSSLQEIIIANFKRSQESSRVLEELFKLYDISISEVFKEIRYTLYSIEKVFLITT